MKPSLCVCLLFVALNLFSSAQAGAQCVFRAVKSGLFSDPTVFSVTGPDNVPCADSPVSGSNASIIINGFTVTLDKDYKIGKGGSITLLNGGALIGGADLTLGDGTGAQEITSIRVMGGAMQVGQLRVNKGSIMVDASSTLQTQCNLVLLNSTIMDNNAIAIYGNLDLSGGGANNTICGSGKVAVRGCVYGTNGDLNQILHCQGSAGVPLSCTQQISTTCPGPIVTVNDSRRNCSALGATGGGACSPLPVELVSFTALPHNQQVDIRWITASEKNNASFVVERSADGQTFSPVHTVAAAGTTLLRTNYAAVDEQPLAGTSYYRLRQTDFDGTAAYSPVRTVQFARTSANSLSLYPGRSAQEWVVSSTLPAEVLSQSATTTQVLDALGRTQPVTPLADATHAGRWTLDVHTLPTGVYIVRLLTSAGVFSQRMVR